MRKSTGLVVFIILLSIIFAGTWWQLGRQDTPTTDRSTGAASNTTNPNQTYTLAQVGTHDQHDDCWTVIDGTVYDITPYVTAHPGGDEILRACGADGSSLFNQRQTTDGQPVGTGTPHSSAASRILSQYRVGTLAD